MQVTKATSSSKGSPINWLLIVAKAAEAKAEQLQAQAGQQAKEG